MKVVIYILVMALVTYLIRALPFTLFKHKVKSPFLRYFFEYIPYAVLAAMTLPYVLEEGKNPYCATIGLIIAVVVSLCKCSLITVALAACCATFLAGLLF